MSLRGLITSPTTLTLGAHHLRQTEVSQLHSALRQQYVLRFYIAVEHFTLPATVAIVERFQQLAEPLDKHSFRNRWGFLGVVSTR